VLDDIEAFNEKRAELAMEELLREEGEKEAKQKERGRHGSKKSSKSKIPASTVGMPPAASDVPTAPATALDHDDLQVAAALSAGAVRCRVVIHFSCSPSADAERCRCGCGCE
jgi:hypothetical protein